MNTTDLRNQAAELIGWGNVTCNKYAQKSGSAMHKAADEIDRLTNEAVAADIRIGNDAQVIARLTVERDALEKRNLRFALCTVALAFEAETLTRKEEMREAIAPYEALLDEIIPEGWSLADEILVVLKGQP